MPHHNQHHHDTLQTSRQQQYPACRPPLATSLACNNTNHDGMPITSGCEDPGGRQEGDQGGATHTVRNAPPFLGPHLIDNNDTPPVCHVTTSSTHQTAVTPQCHPHDDAHCVIHRPGRPPRNCQHQTTYQQLTTRHRNVHDHPQPVTSVTDVPHVADNATADMPRHRHYHGCQAPRTAL